MQKSAHLIALGLFLVAASLPLWLLSDDYLRGIGVRALLVAALAVSWNIIAGFGGRLSLGHAAFFGIGAYTSSLLLINYGISPWVGGIAAMAVAAIAAVVVGAPALRLRGIYFVLVTFVFTLILLNLARYFSDLTGGDVGLSLPLLGQSVGMMQFSGQAGYYYLALVLLGAYVVISMRVVRSGFGYRLRAIRDDEEAAGAVGVATTRVKISAFALSAAMTALIGTVAAQQNLFIDPASAFGVHRTVEIALGAIVGGIGTVWGPVAGGISIIALSDGLNNALHGLVPGADTIVYAVLLIAVALWLPGGIVSIPQRVRDARDRRRRRRSPGRPADEPFDENIRSEVQR